LTRNFQHDLAKLLPRLSLRLRAPEARRRASAAPLPRTEGGLAAQATAGQGGGPY
jgi:hypothetical protein